MQQYAWFVMCEDYMQVFCVLTKEKPTIELLIN